MPRKTKLFCVKHAQIQNLEITNLSTSDALVFVQNANIVVNCHNESIQRLFFFGIKNRPHTGRVALYVRNILFLVLVLQKFSQYQTTLVIELHTSSNDSELLICYPDQHLSHSAPLIYTLLTCCNKDARRSGNSLAEFPAHPYLLFQKKLILFQP